MRESTYRVVPAVDKAARLLAELSEDEGLGISELARRIKASKGTVRDILLTLVSHDLITRDPDGDWVNVGTYRVMVHDEKTLGVFIENGKHGDVIRRKWWARGKPCPMAISVG